MEHVPAFTIVALLAMSTAAAAASTPTTGQLEAHPWQLARATDAQGRRIDALFVRGRPPYTLRFQPGYMSQLNLCNQSSSTYHLQGDRLVLEGGIITTAACIRPEVAEQERVAGTLVNARAELTLALDGRGRLLLRNAHGDVLVFAPVSGTDA
ncbi:META domain-containing protein [Stenotrophomonas muris]|uniref:META domain-containing protein n=1 Tax=Stenotrophomonas muris TaxID=2963283 RepID=UPI0039E23D32